MKRQRQKKVSVRNSQLLELVTNLHLNNFHNFDRLYNHLHTINIRRHTFFAPIHFISPVASGGTVSLTLFVMRHR